MKPISTRDRFLIGLSSSLLLPFAKLYQNGQLLQGDLDLSYLSGLILPFLFLGVIMGIYATIVENEEHNTKRLFRTCFAMPGVLLALAGGGSGETKAVAMYPVVEIKCEKKIQIVQGLVDTYDAFTNNYRERYLLLTREKSTDEFIKHDGQLYWVVGKVKDLPKSPALYYDLRNCVIRGT